MTDHPQTVRETIARALCAYEGGDPDEVFEGAPMWTQYTDEADVSLDALSSAGMKVVGREPTPEMRIEMLAALVKAIEPFEVCEGDDPDRVKWMNLAVQMRNSRETDAAWRAGWDAAEPVGAAK